MKNTLIILLLTYSFAAFAGNNKADRNKEAMAKKWIKNQPLEFIENKGQFIRTDGKTADEVLFKTSFGGCDIYITDKGLSYVFVKMEEVEQNEIMKTENKREEEILHKLKFGEKDKYENKSISYYRLDMNLEGASIIKSNIIKENESKQGHYNYFYAHCPEGIYDVKGYGKITIKNIYKGIDWVIYTNSDSKEHPLKYDFVVHPGADYKDIKIKFLNAQNTNLSDNDSKLKIQTIAGNIEEGNLYSYQTNSNNEISSKYIINKDSIISFEIANYDTTKTLVIDPLVWATYYGGSTSWDGFTSLCRDSADNIYVVGYATTSSFPTMNMNGAFWQSSVVASNDVTIVKFNNQGVRLWATFYGGNHLDVGKSICLDSQNNIFVSGLTFSTNFPVQQLSGAYWQSNNAGFYDICILKFNNQGIRQWATYYGGSGQEETNWTSINLCIDNQDNIYISGNTTSINFPTQQLTGAYNQVVNGGDEDIFILKFNNQGVRQWATYYGGSDKDKYCSISIDSFDNLYITGSTGSTNFPVQQLNGAFWQPLLSGGADLIILKFNNQGIRQWATYYGGSASEIFPTICVDFQDNIYITGTTGSIDFPTQQLIGAYWQPTNAGSWDVFILKFNNQGVRQWASYYGGNDYDEYAYVYADNQNNIFVTGRTLSSNFPTQQLVGEYWQSNNASNAGYQDAFIIKFNNLGQRKWSTFYGGTKDDMICCIAINSQNSVYFT